MSAFNVAAARTYVAGIVICHADFEDVVRMLNGRCACCFVGDHGAQYGLTSLFISFIGRLKNKIRDIYRYFCHGFKYASTESNLSNCQESINKKRVKLLYTYLQNYHRIIVGDFTKPSATIHPTCPLSGHFPEL